MLKKSLALFCSVILLAGCSLSNTNQKGLALFEAALMSGSATNNDFSRAKDYLYACIYSEAGAGEAWGSPMQDVNFTYDNSSGQAVAMGFSFELPALWVGRTYGFIVYGFKNKQPDNFICSKNPPEGVAWARLGRGVFEIKPKPEPLLIPFEDFYESIPSFVAPGISINGGALWTNSLNVKLNLDASSATEVFLSNSGCDSGGVWQVFQPEIPWLLISTNATGTSKVFAKFKNGQGFETSCVSDSILFDNTPPAATLQINGGQSSTTSSTVNLSFSGNETLTEQYITNVSGCGGGGVWEPFSGTKPWSLPNTGTSNVYAKFKDVAGNSSSCVSASIDYTPPVVTPPESGATPISVPVSTSISINNGDSFTDQPNVSLSLQAVDASEVYVTNDPTCLAGGTWTPVSVMPFTISSWPLAQTNAVATVFAKFRNVAGESGCVSDSIIHDSIAPVITTITPSGLEPGITAGQVKVRFRVSESVSPINLYLSSCAGTALTGTITLPLAYPGEVSMESNNLPAGSSQIFAKVVDPSGKSSACVDLGSFKPCTFSKCGYLGVPSCYDPTFVAANSSACLKNGTQVDYVYASGSNRFKVWKENGGAGRILRASGLFEGPGDWQKQLDRKGRAFSTNFLTDSSLIEGRVSPTHIFLNDNNKTATGQWVYYTKDMGAQTLKAASSGIVQEDYLSVWNDINTGNGSRASWYEGNIKTCADLGMRLPTLYETQSDEPTAYLPTDWSPKFGGTRVPKAGTLANVSWTATAVAASGYYGRFWGWGYTTAVSPIYWWESGNNANVRCVLPGN